MAACPVGRVPPDMRKDGYFMKSMKRRLLSLFMAMVMVCSLVPGALAAGTDPNLSVTFTGNTSNLKAGDTLTISAALPSGSEGYTIAPNASYTWTVTASSGTAPTLPSNSSGSSINVTLTEGTYTFKASVTATKETTDGTDTENPPVTPPPTTRASTTVTLEGASVSITVGPADVKITNISFSPNTATVEVGKTVKLTPTIAPDNATSKEIEWLSASPTVATVGTDGTVTGVSTGTATITATAKDGSNKSATCNVTVTPSTVATIAATTNSMLLGGTQTVTLTTGLTDTVTWRSSDESVLTVTGNVNAPKTATITAKKEGTATIHAMVGNVKSNEITISVQNPISISISGNNSGTPTSDKLVGSNSKLDLNVNLNVADSTIKINNVTWKTDSNCVVLSNTMNPVSVYANSIGTANITATVTLSNGQTATGTKKITVTSNASYSVSASVYVESSGYSLGDEDDKGKDSIIEQIDAKLGTKYCTYVWFDSTEHAKGDLDAYKSGVSHSTTDRYDVDDAADVVFTPDSSAKVGDVATFTLTVEDNDRRTHTFEVSFTLIEGTSAGDITYSAALGEDVYFDVSDFEDFYNDKYSSGYLEYVTFGSSSSNGTLYNEDGKTAGSSNYYVDPSKSSQKSLDGIYFSPKSSMKRSTTVKISFTAHGTKRNDTGTGEVSGTVTIFYLNDSASDIVYNTTAGKVTLDPKDFNEAYKQATGSKTAPSNLTIEFQNVPSNGTLTYTGGSKDKDLTKSNVKSNRYTTKSNGTYRLAQLTYTGTRGKDTIDYIAYSGGTAQFSGKVVFNGTAAVPTDVVVTYGSTGGQAVRFSQNDFVSANSAMSKATKVRFVAPANGTLLMNGASASGVDIATTLLGTVTYQPKSGFNGQDKIIFAAYDASNNTVASGTVNVTVIGNPTTGTTPGGTPGGVSDVSQFKDVSATAWYRDNLATLVRKGIITGKGDGKFDPLGTVTYGEALKMVLESCGYTAALGTGSNWAINYKNLAVSRGWISSDIDLNAAISRNATAELTAKVLGVSAVTSGSPFADEANGYAAALYYTSPQIFAGSPNPNGGKPLFKNSSPLLRQEVCAVICRVSDYHTQHTTNNMPDGI